MTANQWRAPEGVDSKTLGQRRDADVNRDRLVFCYTNLVGHRVTVKLRDQLTYEGLFHGCALDGDMSITLKCARRLPSQEHLSGEVIDTLMIPAKDFLRISAEDVPPLGTDEHESGALANRGFAIDGEISGVKAPSNGERELVQWQPQADEGAISGDLGNSGGRKWDQFQVNEQMFGVSTTYNEDFYTTKLDPTSIPQSKRDEADRIAREIEGGETYEVEQRVDGDEDEEADFSAVTGTGACQRKGSRQLPGDLGAPADEGKSSTASVKGVPQVPLTEEHLCQHDSLSGVDAFQREHRTKRGMITAHSQMRTPMFSEMKRINALNLEPALPKLDDQTRNDWISFKHSQTQKNAPKPSQGTGLKDEFKQSLDLFRKREASMKKDVESTQQPENSLASSSTAVPDRNEDKTGHRGKESSSMVLVPAPSESSRTGEASNPKASSSTAVVTNGVVAASPSGTSERKSSFSFNPAAKEFSFNPQATAFTPTSAGTDKPPSFGFQAQQNTAPSPKAQSSTLQFTVSVVNSELLRTSLTELLSPFFELTSRESAHPKEPCWPEAVGPPSKQVLGQPNPSNPMPPVGAMPGGAVPGGWQQPPQQQQVPQGVAPAQPQMIAAQQGGFMVQQPPSGGQPGQMFQPMYRAPQGNMPPQRPPQGGNMPMQTQQMVFNQQGQPMGQPGQMGAMPKFQGQVAIPVMAPGGQFPQGFAPQQGQTGQQQPQGPPQMGHPHNQMMQQTFVPPSQQGGKRS